MRSLVRKDDERSTALRITVDEQNHRATNVYLWDTEEAARGFFSEELVEGVTGLYGVRPTVTFVKVAELVDNE